MGLGGKNPAEVAGIKVEGENKWLTLIQNASAKRVPTVNAPSKEDDVPRSWANYFRDSTPRGFSQAGESLGSVWPCFPSCRQRPLPERLSPLSVPGRLQRRGVPRMSEVPPSVPRFGLDFGLVRGETGASERFPASPRFSLGSPEAVSRISEARFSVQTGPVLHPR